MVGTVASNKGWHDVIEWCDTLPFAEYELLIQFIEHGYCTQHKGTISLLARAINEYPPKVDGVETTLKGLLAKMRRHQSAEILIVTDNVGVADDKPARKKPAGKKSNKNLKDYP